jgi:hypothetical protein
MRTIPGKSEFEPPPSKADFLTSPQRQFPTSSGHFTPIPTVESVLLVINAMLNITRELWQAERWRHSGNVAPLQDASRCETTE